jgi:hypothetical protein
VVCATPHDTQTGGLPGSEKLTVPQDDQAAASSCGGSSNTGMMSVQRVDYCEDHPDSGNEPAE